MKIILPAIPFTKRWYAVPITCPHCYSEFALEEDDIQECEPPYYDILRTFQLTPTGIGGTCPSCHSAIYVEKPA